MFHIVLVHPEIPPNTGNVIRLAANTGCTLHLVEPLGFSMDDKLLRRAGLDYHEYAPVRRHASWQALVDAERPDPARCFAFTTRGTQAFGAVAWQPGDWLVFGSEGGGPATGAARELPASAAAAAADAPGPAQPEPQQCRGGGGLRGLAAERLRRQLSRREGCTAVSPRLRRAPRASSAATSPARAPGALPARRPRSP